MLDQAGHVGRADPFAASVGLAGASGLGPSRGCRTFARAAAEYRAQHVLGGSWYF